MKSKSYIQRRVAITTLVFLLLIISCNENSIIPPTTSPTSTFSGKVSSNTRIINYTFDGTEGDAINLDTASNWIDHYMNTKNKIIANYFSKKSLETIMGKTGSMGIRFYYSKNEAGQPILMAVGADKDGNDFQSAFRMMGEYSSVNLFEMSPSETFTGNELDSVTAETSKIWISNYSKENPTEIIAHFFGYQIIKQILSKKNCVGIRCYYAFKDKLGEAKLILVGVDSNGKNILPISNTGGRTSTEDPALADYSFPCPSYCSGT